MPHKNGFKEQQRKVSTISSNSYIKRAFSLKNLQSNIYLYKYIYSLLESKLFSESSAATQLPATAWDLLASSTVLLALKWDDINLLLPADMTKGQQ